MNDVGRGEDAVKRDGMITLEDSWSREYGVVVRLNGSTHLRSPHHQGGTVSPEEPLPEVLRGFVGVILVVLRPSVYNLGDFVYGISLQSRRPVVRSFCSIKQNWTCNSAEEGSGLERYDGRTHEKLIFGPQTGMILAESMQI